MRPDKEGPAFNRLRALVLQLDIRLGVERRKLILAGHEKLTLVTNSREWGTWLAGVETRLERTVGTRLAMEMLTSLAQGHESPNTGSHSN